MTILQGLWQGILQGLTEFLPISSSGHLNLFQHFFGLASDEALFFNLMLHLGTLAAVIAAYYEDLWAMLKEVGRIFSEVFTGRFRAEIKTPERRMLSMLIVATLPMLLVLPLRKFVGRISADDDIVIEGLCFLFTSLMLFAACKVKPGKAGIGKMRVKQAVLIGVMQCIAVLPGVSRSGVTIATGIILGFDRGLMVKFSFLLGIPAILGGAISEIGAAALEEDKAAFGPLFVGMLAAAVVGYLCIRLVRWLVVTNKLKVFAWYTLVLGGVVVVTGVIQHILAAAGGAPAPSGASGTSSGLGSLPDSGSAPLPGDGSSAVPGAASPTRLLN